MRSTYEIVRWNPERRKVGRWAQQDQTPAFSSSPAAVWRSPSSVFDDWQSYVCLFSTKLIYAFRHLLFWQCQVLAGQAGPPLCYAGPFVVGTLGLGCRGPAHADVGSCRVRISVLHGVWDLVALTWDWTACPVLQGRFTTTGTPGKSFKPNFKSLHHVLRQWILRFGLPLLVLHRIFCYFLK